MGNILRIGVQVERSRAHGRMLLEGIAEFALSQYEWRMDLLDPRKMTDRETLSLYDGFIARVMDAETAEALRAVGRPVVDTYGRLDSCAFTTLRLDDCAISRMAAEFYADRLFTTCAYCGFPRIRFSDARGEAFRQACEERGIKCHLYENVGGASVSDTFFREEQAGRPADASALRKWLKSLKRPCAIFCCNDIRAFQLMKVCEDLEMRVPKDVAVLGVDNDTILCTFTKSPLSSIDTDPFSLGRRAGELLAELMAEPGTPPQMYLHPPRRVIERASTDVFQFSIPWLSDALVYIQRNLAKGVNASDVVRHLGYSHTAVNKAFQAELGTTVHQELMRRRLALACKRLLETDLPAARIAIDTGFKTPQYFSQVFSSTHGMSPDAWRRKRFACLQE